MTRRSTIAAAAALALLAGATGAAGQGPMRADTDGDGAITRAEAAAARDRLFDRLDRNADGVIGPAEIEALERRVTLRTGMMRQRLSLALMRRDSDGDGAITRAEMQVEGPFFAVADADGDGVISAQERARVRRLAPDVAR